VRRLSTTQFGAWIFSHVAHHADRFFMYISGNRMSLSTLLAGIPVVWLTTTGAKSGKTRTLPLMGILDGRRVILIASDFGQSHHPGWYYNLKANPEVRLSYGGKSGIYIAKEAKDEQKQVYWRNALKLFPGYAIYQKRAAGREIPVLVLSPKITENS
jgi:deazaflavin-dependent oxidoreductase (nitroreductase family)